MKDNPGVLHVGQMAERRGAEVVMVRLLSELARRGHRVAAALPCNGPIAEELLGRDLPVHILDPSTQRMGARSLRPLVHLVRSKQPDILHTHDGPTTLLGRLCRQAIPTIRLVSSAHGLRQRHYGPQFALMGLAGRARRRVRALAIHHLDRMSRGLSDVIVAHSRAIASELIKDGAPRERLVVLPHGLPDEWLINGTRSSGALRQALPERLRRRTLVGLVGAVEPSKGHHVLLDAIPHITEWCTDVTFIFIGPQPHPGYRAKLERRARQLGVLESLHFLGAVDGIRDIMADLDVPVQASFTEGLPLVVMEAMAVGTAVVATAVGGTSELVEDGRTGILLPAGDAAALAQGVRKLVVDRSERLRLSLSARDHARKAFAIGRVVDVLERPYQSLLATGPHSRRYDTSCDCSSRGPLR